MKITRIDAFQVRWTPDEKPTQHSAFVRIFTDQEIDGIGEASPMLGGLASLGIIRHDLAPALLGKDPLDGCRPLFDASTREHDPRALQRQHARGFESDARVGAGNDGGAAALIGNVLEFPWFHRRWVPFAINEQGLLYAMNPSCQV